LTTTWEPDADGPGPTIGVRSIVVDGGIVYVGGEGFLAIGGQQRKCLAALDAGTGLATPWNPNSDGNVFTLALSAGLLYVGGNFSSIGGQPRESIAALDAGTAAATSWNPGDATEAWDVEIERRAAEITAGTAETLTLDEYRARVRQRRARRAAR
jgi:trimeric autotransporter adhesin